MLFVRFAKLASVFFFVAGTLGAILPGLPLASRRRLVFWFAAPGFGCTWGFGFLLVALTRQSVLSTWILGSLALSLLDVNALLYIVGREGRLSVVSGGLALVCLLGTLALMVWRPA